MPATGYSGRATNEEDYADPYGGGDKPGPYGYVNDPYDGDWALNPLGGKQIKMQSLFRAPMVAPRAPVMQAKGQMQAAMGDDNIWNEGVMGTNSIFMHQMTSKDAQMNLEMKRSQPAPSEPVGPGGAGADSSWVGTNSVFFGSNGGGYGWARAPTQKIMKGQALRSIDKSKSVYRDGYSSNTIQSVPVLGGTNAAFNLADGYHYGWAKKPQSPKTNRVQKSHLQSLFRSADAHEAEYGREGDNQLNDDVLPSAVGTGGPVIGVDGKPSNIDHTWAKHQEEFSFKCSEDIPGCAEGLTVDPEYAAD
mmetsp:Transcript_46460/g.123298  ORF Transcript_46460/g.123298 Transcript_46460/m.123298 type:complete len:305 (-) Transcript_46460:197-1111(-)